MNSVSEKKTFSEWLKRLDDQSNEYSNAVFVKNVRSWLERLHLSEDLVTEWAVTVDIMDITDKKDRNWKKKIAGPYNRIKLTYEGGSIKYGRWLHNSDGTIEDDEEENWNTLWIRRTEPQYVITICKTCKRIRYSKLFGFREDDKERFQGYGQVEEAIRIADKCDCDDNIYRRYKSEKK